MSKAEIERFIGDLAGTSSLQEAVKGKAGDTASLVAIARSQGYEITIEDVRAHVRAHQHDLTDEEVDAAVGGATGMGGITQMGMSWYKTP